MSLLLGLALAFLKPPLVLAAALGLLAGLAVLRSTQVSLWAVMGVATLLLGIVGIFSTRTNAQSGVVFKARPLIDASIEEIQQAALDYTYTRFKVLSEAPTILLVRQVTKDELPSLGLSAIGFAGEEPPLMLVAMKGDFDVSNIRGRVRSSVPFRVKYIVYVFDLKVGAPTLIGASVDGSHFPTLLNGPNLPQEPPAPESSN